MMVYNVERGYLARGDSMRAHLSHEMFAANTPNGRDS